MTDDIEHLDFEVDIHRVQLGAMWDEHMRYRDEIDRKFLEVIRRNGRRFVRKNRIIISALAVVYTAADITGWVMGFNGPSEGWWLGGFYVAAGFIWWASAWVARRQIHHEVEKTLLDRAAYVARWRPLAEEV